MRTVATAPTNGRIIGRFPAELAPLVVDLRVEGVARRAAALRAVGKRATYLCQVGIAIAMLPLSPTCLLPCLLLRAAMTSLNLYFFKKLLPTRSVGKKRARDEGT